MKFMLVFLLSLLSFICNAQERNKIERKNTISLELLGNGIMGSINYDRIILQGDRLKWFGRIGFSEYHGGGNELNFFAIYETGVLFGNEKHNLDFGLGLTDRLNRNELGLIPRLSYRFTAQKGFHLRACPLMYVFDFPTEEEGWGGYWVALALGYSF
jgi:hypothetical protein